MGRMTREQIIGDILDKELKMFLAVNAREKASCQEHPEDFRFYRNCMFSVWSTEGLMSYRDDLQRAEKEGQNLVTLKYARMENLIPVLNNSALISKIIEIELGWTKELALQFPHVKKRGRPIEKDPPGSVSVKTYLQGELETYSESTLQLYYDNLIVNLEKGENLTLKITEAMAVGAGYSSLDEAEKALEKDDNRLNNVGKLSD